MVDLTNTAYHPEAACEPEGLTEDTPISGVAKARAFLASPWTGAVLVVAMIAALRLIAPWSEWVGYLSDANTWWLVGAALLVLPHTFLRVLRFEGFLPELRPHRGPHLRMSYAMTCVGQLPVGTIGGDAFRIIKFTCLGVDAERSTASTALLRVLGFTVTLGTAGALAAWFMGSALPLLALALSLFIVFLLATSTHPPAFVSRLYLDPDTQTPASAPWWRKALETSRRVLARTLGQAREMSRPRLLSIVAITLGMVALKGAMLWACARAVGIVEVGPLGAVFALVAGNLASAVPSPAGNVGLREGGIVGAFAILGAGATVAAVAAILFRAAMIVGALIGWGVMVLAAKSPEEVHAERSGDLPAN